MSYPPYQGPPQEPVPPAPTGYQGYGGFPPPAPPPQGPNTKTIWIIGGVAAAVVVVLLTTIGVVIALSGGDETTPTANPSHSATTDETTEPEPEDESSSPSDEPSDEDTDDSPGGTHQPVDHMCAKLDGTPLRALYDTPYGEPSESKRESTDVGISTCVTTLTKGSNRRQRAMVACTGYYYPDNDEAARFLDAMRDSAKSTLAKGPIEDVPGLGDKAFIYPSTNSRDYYTFKMFVLDENLVLHASVMASYPPGWQPATINQLKQGLIASAKASLPKITSS